MVFSLKRNLYRQFIKNETALHELRYLFWECTLRCNLNCLHCGSDCYASSEINDMEADIFLEQAKIISKEFNPGAITVVITGGEPLMRKDIEYVGRELKNMGFRWSLVTNGYMYTQQRHKRLIEAGIGAVTLSFDGLEQTHNWLRNSKSSFSKALSALELLVRAPKINFDVVTCVHQKNIDELEEIGRFLSEKGLKEWRLFTIAPKGRAVRTDSLKLTQEQLHKLLEFIKYNRVIDGMNVRFSCEGYVREYENEVRDGYFFCRAGIHIGSILADGSVNACPNIDRKISQGNIYEEDFPSVWNNEFGVMRNRKWNKQGQCSGCKEYKWCNGNGLHLWDYENKKLLQCHVRHFDSRGHG